MYYAMFSTDLNENDPSHQRILLETFKDLRSAQSFCFNTVRDLAYVHRSVVSFKSVLLINTHGLVMSIRAYTSLEDYEKNGKNIILGKLIIETDTYDGEEWTYDELVGNRIDMSELIANLLNA
jgi:hypothetical protein